MTKHRPAIIALLLFSSVLIGTLIAGCSEKASTEEKAEFARLYAEILIAENMYRADSARQLKVIDSILGGSDFESRDEVRTWLEELTVNDPEGLQEMLDSTQRYLERVRDTATAQ